jgi:hypothetical protein
MLKYYTGIAAPGSPTGVFAIRGDGQVSVYFTAPTNNGGAVITGYTVSSTPSVTPQSGSSSPITISGLTNGTDYTFTVVATNSVGNSAPSSASNTATPGTTRQTFTTVGSSTWTAPVDVNTVQYLVVGGGGGSGGAFDTGGGGGGGGGMVRSGSLSVNPGDGYSVVVGGGGAGGISIRSPVSETQGASGENSSFSDITALGGGGGYGSRMQFGFSGNGGAAATPPSTASAGGYGGGSTDGGGGGGGSSGSGGNKSGTSNVNGGNGGTGTSSSISGANTTYGVGGSGANGNTRNVAIAGEDNTGNGARGAGAAGSSDEDGAAGGSGIVIIVY